MGKVVGSRGRNHTFCKNVVKDLGPNFGGNEAAVERRG